MHFYHRHGLTWEEVSNCCSSQWICQIADCPGTMLGWGGHCQRMGQKFHPVGSRVRSCWEGTSSFRFGHHLLFFSQALQPSLIVLAIPILSEAFEHAQYTRMMKLRTVKSSLKVLNQRHCDQPRTICAPGPFLPFLPPGSGLSSMWQ